MSSDADVKFWFDYQREHPRTFRLESELPVPDLPAPLRIDPEIKIECEQESADDENWTCPNRAVWQIGFVYVCDDCYRKHWAG